LSCVVWHHNGCGNAKQEQPTNMEHQILSFYLQVVFCGSCFFYLS